MGYDRQRAVDYAHRWAYDRNPAYYDFEHLGGDCTNFASQCIFAGSGRMNYTKTFGWYYINLNNRAPAWTGVEYLYNFLTTNRGAGPYGRQASINEVEKGDIVQLKFANMERFSHSPVIVQINSRTPGGILIAAHSYNSDYRPLNTYSYLEHRFVHIEGVR